MAQNSKVVFFILNSSWGLVKHPVLCAPGLLTILSGDFCSVSTLVTHSLVDFQPSVTEEMKKGESLTDLLTVFVRNKMYGRVSDDGTQAPIFDRPVVAEAVLQTTFWFKRSLLWSSIKNSFNIAFLVQKLWCCRVGVRKLRWFWMVLEFAQGGSLTNAATPFSRLFWPSSICIHING